MSKNKILLVQIAALGYNFLKENLGEEQFLGLKINPINTVFPALTCPAQASIRTGKYPSEHGVVANGFFSKELNRPFFWEQNSGLAAGGRIWDKLRERGGTVAQLFVQQSLGADSDIFISPAPIHKHHGGMIMDCASKPPELNLRLTRELGAFPLQNYWGPLASKSSSEWIASAITSVMSNEKPDFIYAYLPHLDYDLQRFGPGSEKGKKAFKDLVRIAGKVREDASKNGYKTIFFSDYSITEARGVVYLNKALRARGLFKTRAVKNMLYPDFYSSSAFALVDHQIAHVHIFDRTKIHEVRELLEKTEGVERALDDKGKTELKIDNPRSGDLVLIAKPGYWFDYRWWDRRSEAPEFASHVDIHNKPGYDPCELYFGWPPGSVSSDPSRIRGTHGRADEKEPVFYAGDIEFPEKPKNLVEFAQGLRALLDTL
jgi:predicted AlkP superfamily pyrophosphatase or phosphodiesterase